MLDERASLTQLYFESLPRLRRLSWSEADNATRSATFPERLVLVHPDWLSDAEFGSKIELVQGERAFSGSISGTAKCESQVIWGYACSIEDTIQRDHLWPYALGGPTKPGNFIYLCRLHNYLKGVDVHCYPWDEAESRLLIWLEDQISLLRGLLGS